ncbi:MAG: sulfatase [Planctomycetota bacterium]
MTSSDRPNILFIFSDQQSADMMSCAGNGDLHTPAMDALAARGVRFERAYCAQPLCVPSRSAMSTGRYPHEVGAPFNFHPHEMDVPENLDWVGALLRDAGYDTAYFGKWHQPVAPERKDIHGWRQVALEKDPELPRVCEAFFDERRTERRERPFFLTVSFLAPHEVCQAARGQDLPNGNVGTPPAPEACPALPSNVDVPDEEPDVLRQVMPMSPGAYPTADWNNDDWRRFRWTYARLVERLDGWLAGILDSLDRHGLADNTVIVYSADHGDGAGAHRWNQKQSLYEEPSRVPLILCDPDGGGGRTETSSLVSTGLDLLPTFCDYAGIPAPAGLSGRSLRPFARGRRPDDWRDHLVVETEFGKFSEPFGIAGRAVYTDRYKYVVYSQGRRREHLTDLRADPGEMHNLAGRDAYAEQLRRHRRLLRTWQQTTGDGWDFAEVTSSP